MEPPVIECPMDGCPYLMRQVDTGYIDDKIFNHKERHVSYYRCPNGHEAWLRGEEEA